MPDLILECPECQQPFTFTEAEQAHCAKTLFHRQPFALIVIASAKP